MVSNQEDLKKGYFELDDDHDTERHDIAKKQGDAAAANFGRKRNTREEIQKLDIYPYSPLNYSAYKEYGDKLLASLQERLKKIPHDNKGFHAKMERTEEPPCLGRRSEVVIEVLSQQDIKERKWDREADWTSSKKACEILMKKWIWAKDKMTALKNAEPDLWKQDCMRFHIQTLNDTFDKFKKTHYVLVTQNFQINDKMVPISQFLTWLECNGKDDPIQNMTGNSVIVILHQDPLLLDETLQDIAAVFETAVQCKPQDNVEELQNHQGLLRYEQAHAMPKFRGSCAEAEWKERTIYGHHGHDTAYASNKCTDLEALTSFSLHEFMQRYPSTIILKKRAEGEKAQS